jgi:hypothetical protein
MKRRFLPSLSVASIMLIAAALGWSQTPDTEGPPPPPPDGQFFFVQGGPMFEAVKPVTGAPFSAQATTQISQTLADGNQINRTETAQIARDSAGRTRRDATITHVGALSSAGTPREIVSISDPVADAHYILDVTDKTAVKMRFTSKMRRGAGSGPRWRMHANEASPGQPAIERTNESLGTQVMAGLTVEGTRITETIPAGTIGNQNPIVTISERWVSPQLQETIYSKRTDPRFGTTIYQLTNISRAEPDASLFQVPSNYTVKEGLGIRTRGASAGGLSE